MGSILFGLLIGVTALLAGAVVMGSLETVGLVQARESAPSWVRLLGSFVSAAVFCAVALWMRRHLKKVHRQLLDEKGVRNEKDMGE